MANDTTKTNKRRNKDVDAKNALARRRDRQSKRGTEVTTDWESVSPELCLRLIATVANFGGTTTFGYTIDKGAYYINYWVDGESEKVYIRPTEDVDERLANEIESWM